GWALAELTIPGLQCVGSRLVLYHFVHPPADLVHLLEIRQLHQASHLFRRGRIVGFRLPRQNRTEVADNVGPSVADEVLLLAAAGDEDIEVFHASALPTGSERLDPFRIGRAIPALIDRRRRALEDIQLLRVFAEVGHALD